MLVDRQGCVDRHVALDQRERDRAELVVAGARSRRSRRRDPRTTPGSRRAAAGSPSRRGAAAPAGAADGRGCGPARPSPGRGSSPCRGAPRRRSSRPRWGSCGGRCRCRAAARRARCAAPRRPTGRTPARPPRRTPRGGRGAPGRSGQPFGRSRRTPHHGEVVDEGDLDAGHELHPLEPLRQRRARAGLGVGGERLAVVDAGEGVLDVALRAQHQRLGPGAGGEAVEVLRGQVVQPDSRSGPEMRTTSRCERSTNPSPRARLRCSVLKEP